MNLLIEKLQITLPVSIYEFVVRASVIVSEMGQFGLYNQISG